MLSFYLDKSHPTYTVVQKFIKQLARKIPRYRANNRTDNDVPTLCSHLTREFLTVCNEDFLMIDYKVNHPIRFFQHRLEAVSLYRYVEEYLRYPTGLAVEYLLYSKRLKCPLSGKRLDLNGGCEAAWADIYYGHNPFDFDDVSNMYLHCSRRQVFIYRCSCNNDPRIAVSGFEIHPCTNACIRYSPVGYITLME